MKMNKRKLLKAICEALVIYGLIIVGYGILVNHITRTWSGDWPVDRNLPWLTLDIFMMISFALSFFAYIAWRYLKFLDSSSQHACIRHTNGGEGVPNKELLVFELCGRKF